MYGYPYNPVNYITIYFVLVHKLSKVYKVYKLYKLCYMVPGTLIYTSRNMKTKVTGDYSDGYERADVLATLYFWVVSATVAPRHAASIRLQICQCQRLSRAAYHF